jgi:FkbM family methyltransferase
MSFLEFGAIAQRKLSKIHGMKRILDFIITSFFSYYVRTIEKGLVQSRLPAGVIIQPSDSLVENYSIYRSKVFEAFHEVQNDDVVIDVGAHVGIFTIKAARKARNGFVVAIEPHVPNYKLLIYNIASNNIKNAIAVNSALSNCSGTAKLYIDTQSVGHTIDRKKSSTSCIKERYAECATQTLDELVDRMKLPKVDFIKINVEGSELNVLKGAERTLGKNNSFLAIAADHHKGEVEEVSKYLQERGYEPFPYNYMRFVYARKARRAPSHKAVSTFSTPSTPSQ